MPALLTSTSTRPRQATARSHSAGDRAPGRRGRRRRRARARRARRRARRGGRPRAGRAARRRRRAPAIVRAVAAPIPPAAPVTSTTRSVKSIMGPPVGSAALSASVRSISLRTIASPSSTPMPGLASSWSAPGAQREVHGDLGGALGLAARAAEVRDDAVAPAVEHRLDDVVHRAEVRRLDLDDVGGARAVEGADVLDGVGPLVGDDPDRAPATQRAQRGERLDLGVARAGVERVLDPQRERRGRLAERDAARRPRARGRRRTALRSARRRRSAGSGA